MADPLSISTAVITFAGAAIKTTSEIHNIVSGLSSAEEDINALNSEIQDLAAILRKLVDLQSSIRQLDSSKLGLTAGTLKSLQKDLASLKIVATRLQSQVSGGRLQRFKARYQFSYGKKPTITSFVARIQTSKSRLTLALAVLHGVQGEDTLKELKLSGDALKKLTSASADQTSGILILQKSLDDRNLGLRMIKQSADDVFNEIGRIETSIASNHGVIQGLNTRTHNDLDRIKESLSTIDQRTKMLRTTTLPIIPDGTCRIIPYPRNERFTGRSDVLQQLRSELVHPTSREQRFGSFALCGLPGVGKTQTALKFVYDNESEFPLLFWVSASSKDKLILGFDGIARSLGLNKNVAVADQEENVRVVKTWLTSTETRWLLVFDNVECVEDIGSFWISPPNGSILVTAQDPTAARGLASKTCKLSPFTTEEGISLINTISQTSKGSITVSEAGQIAKALGHHPLAINQMSNFIIDSGCSVPFFLGLYAQREQSNELQGLDCNCPWYENTVAAAFDLIIERAGKLGSQAAVVLDVLSFFDPDRIQEEMLTRDCLNVTSDVHRLIAIKDLRRMALLDDNTEIGTVSVHRLVQDAVLRKLETSTERAHKAFSTAVALLRKMFPLHSASRDHMTESWSSCENFLPHVLSLHKRYGEFLSLSSFGASMDFVELLYSCAWYLCERGRFDISATLIITAEMVYTALDDKEDELFLADLRTVKLFYANETDHHNSSIELATEALNIREDAVRCAVLDKDHPNRANGFMYLGVMYAKVDPEKAIQLHTTALGIRTMSTRYQSEQIHGLALNYLNLGRSYWCAGHLDEAAASFETCLATIKVREESCGYRFAISGWALWALANVEIDRGRLNDALVLHTQSMDLNEKTLGPAHLKTAASYHKMAWLLWKHGELTRATDILNLALSVYDERADGLVAERARSKWLLAQVLKDLNAKSGTHEDWDVVEQEAQQLRSEVVGKDDTGGSKQEDYDSLVAYFYL